LNEEALDESIWRHFTFLKRTRPGPECLSVGADEHRIVNNKGIFGALHRRPKSLDPAWQPEIILMKEAGPVACGLT
jgi:hypothetical protein